MVARPDGENPEPIKAEASASASAVTPVQIAAKHARCTIKNGMVDGKTISVDESRSKDGSKFERGSWLMGTNDPILRGRSAARSMSIRTITYTRWLAPPKYAPGRRRQTTAARLR